MTRVLFLGFAALSLWAKAPAFQPHTLAADLKGGYQVVPADLNRDGRPDLIALASGMTELVWFENPGPGAAEWPRRTLVTGIARAINLAAGDIDGDGVPEIVLATDFANTAKNSVGTVWLLQHRGDPRQEWSKREIDKLTTSHRIRVARLAGGPVFVNAPLTGAQADAPDYRGHTPLVFYRPGEWKRQVIGDQNEGVVHGIYIADWDGDGRDEILTASFVGLHLYRQEKNGAWTRTELSKGDPAPWPKSGSSDVAVGRSGKQRFLAAIEPWHGESVAVYTGKALTRTVIDRSLVDGHTILTADLDGDRNDEIVAGYRGTGRSVYIYSGAGTSWTKSVLDEGGIAAAACAAADLNGDKRIDIACIGSATANLKWYENLGK